MKKYVDHNGNMSPCSIVVEGIEIKNPTEEQYVAAGFYEYVHPVLVPALPTYDELVTEYIRGNGYPTYDDELSILNNYAENPTEYLDAWQSYTSVRNSAKEWAKEQPHS